VVTEELIQERSAITDVTTLISLTDAEPTARFHIAVMVSSISVRSVILVNSPTPMSPMLAEPPALFQSAVMVSSIQVNNVTMETEEKVMVATQCAVTSVVTDSSTVVRSAITVH
jgi:hypothetical protein